MLFFLSVLLALALELIIASTGAWSRLGALRMRIRAWVPARIGPAVLGALVVAFAIELIVVNRAAQAGLPHASWLRALPIAVTYADPVDYVPQMMRIGFVVISVLEALLLAVFLLAVYDRPWRRIDTITTAIAAAVMTLLALTSPAMTSSDMYAYVADALLGGTGAYSPPATPLTGEFGVIHHTWGLPLLPAAYGPLWLWWNSAVVGLVAGLHAKLILLRVINVFALGVTLGALRLLRVAPSLIAAAAVNPAIAFYYITNGHNDIVVIALVLVAMTFAGRYPAGAGIVAGIAASIKLTLFVPAAGAALVITTLRRRLTFTAAMLVTAVAIALILGGRPYLHALSIISLKYSDHNKLASVRIPHILVALVTVALTAVAVFTRRTYRSLVFGFSSLAQAFLPWYVIWGLPYAAARNDVLVTLLVGFPIATAVLDNQIHTKVIGAIVVVALLLAIGAALTERRLFSRTASNA